MTTSPGDASRPGAEVDLFALFDLPRRFAVDLGELERRYLERSRAVHPDRAVGASAEVRARAAGASIDLNRAYRVLKRGASRAEHLLALEGVAIGDNERVDPALLHEVLELREELEEARARRDQAELARLEAAMKGRERRELDRAAAALDAAAGASGEARAAALAEAKAACLALRYVHRYLEALEPEDDDTDDDEEDGA